MSTLLTIDNERLEEVIASAAQFADTPSIELNLIELKEAQKKIDEAVKMVQASLKEKMVTDDLSSIDGDHLRVTVSASGAKYKAAIITDVDPQFLKVTLDSTAVGAFVKDNEKLPEGVEENDERGYAVRLTIKGGAHD